MIPGYIHEPKTIIITLAQDYANKNQKESSVYATDDEDIFKIAV